MAMNKNTTEQVTVGDKYYSVDLKRIPYFESFFQSRNCSQKGSNAVYEHDDIPFFDIIHHGVSHGYRHFFRRMTDQISDWHQLCRTLKFLSVDVIGGKTPREIFGEIKSTKEIDEETPWLDKTQKLTARDAAFKLVYLFIVGSFDSAAMDKNMAWNTTLYVISHRRVFGCRTRKIVLSVYEDKFEVTPKQRKELDKWPVDLPMGMDWQRSEETTESEPCCYSDFSFDSDWS